MDEYKKRQPKFLTGDELPKRLKMSRKQEKSGCKKLGVAPTVGSGNKHKKGDGQSKSRQVEFKSTEKKQYTLKQADLEKLWHNARVNGQEAIFVIRFGGMSHAPSDWALVPQWRLEELLEKEQLLDRE